ncbi:MAG TPA: ATP-binding protein [Anaeromyxobacteraceae bacterium]|nr:ATP-binding protein [Anaeromyxobacteraceae bacterium]
MDVATRDLEERWQRWLVRRNRRSLRIALYIGLSLYPAFGLLDVLVGRPVLLWLWATRVLFVALTLALFPLLRTRFFERWGDLLGVGYLWAAAGGIAVMTTYMGGLASPYYAGLTMTVVAAGLLFMWPPTLVVLAHSAIVGGFVILNVTLGRIGPRFEATSNLMFLSSTALIAAAGQILAFRSQREQVLQRVQLERATARLEQAHAELQQLDRFKSRFSANMTHELRTPLAMVLTPLELMLQGEVGEFTEAQRSSFQAMFKSALKLLKIVNDLLDLSRLEESRLRLEVGEHDLVAQLVSLTEDSQVLARRKSIELELRPPSAATVAVWYDLERMERVFVNLLSNAIKFTPPGGHVTVAVEDGADAVAVTVADDGPGFPPELATRIFERFYQVDMAGTRQFGGAGIGLALARELVALHGGAIRAESDGRRGARFTVTLPKGRSHLRPDAPAPVHPGEEGHDGDAGLDWAVQLSSRREFRLLDIEEAAERRVVERDLDEGARPYTAVVVEDSPQIVRLVHMALRRQFKLLAAPDGLKGLEMVRREQPSLVVTDLMMPGIDGLELTRRLREDPATRHVPILMLTARGDLEDRVLGLETGVSAYLTKPFSPKELVTCARQLVQAEEETAELVLTQRMESLEIVAAGLAHEMNNPLNYVKNALGRVKLDAEEALSLAGAAAERPLDPAERERLAGLAARVRELLGVADSGLRRIGGTVELMGRYGRAGFRREQVLIDAWEAVRTVVAVVLPATGRDATVECDLQGDGTLECVPEEFNQVLTNLVQNAIEAVPEGSGRVLLRGELDGPSLRLSVRDNGPGVPPEVRARLFTPFYTTKGPGRGTGLGLTIARRVVQSLGGTLQLASAPGEGAEFVVRVPRKKRPA